MKNKEELYLLAKERYYSGNPIMSDEEFDNLESSLSKEGSKVINKIGAGLTNDRVKFKHLSPMLSLSKISVSKDGKIPYDNFIRWYNKIGRVDLDISPKYDGNAVTIHYKDGVYIKALSRGDGSVGLDLTDKLSNIVPNKIDIGGLIEVRGEILMPLFTFSKKYSSFKNPRNLVSGILGQKEERLNIPNLDIVFMPYEIRLIYPFGWRFSEEDIYQVFKRNGFKIPNYTNIYSTDSDAEIRTKLDNIYLHYKEYRDHAEYQLDGIVFKVLSSQRRLELGEQSHHPEWALALKFPPKMVVTKILDIEWAGGKTGHLTPVAILDPVDLDGSVVSRCTLHNYNNVVTNGLYPGAEISLVKAGDIIPQVESIITSVDNTNYVFPKDCPSCGSVLEISDVHLTCLNKGCGGLRLKQLETAVGLLGLDFFGSKTIENFYDAGITDIYKLLDPYVCTKDNLCRSGLFKPGRTLDRLLYQISTVKEIALWKVIIMLNIPNLGNTISKELELKFSGLPYKTKGLNKEILEGFSNNGIYTLLLQNTIKLFEDIGIKVLFIEKAKEQEMSNKDSFTFEMTGSPKPFFETKAVFEKFVSDLGGVGTKLDKDCRYLFTDDYTSETTKMKKAKSLGVEIITYEDFLKKNK